MILLLDSTEGRTGGVQGRLRLEIEGNSPPNTLEGGLEFEGALANLADAIIFYPEG